MGEAQPTAPRVLGRYALYDTIASGGMATVHVGRMLGPVGFARTVAIKRLHPQFAGDPEFVAMFLDEARLVARISHPNVVPTLDVVATDGELFLVMEYVRGESLAKLMRAAARANAPIPSQIVATIMVGVLQGLHAAHEAKNEQGAALGIVHRDVTPQNILVGVDGVARVLDFGVAKATGRAQTTKNGQLKGKLSYMAPEQLQGKVTRSTDIYAASVVMWEALAGRRLFAGDNEGHIFSQVREGCKLPPSFHYPPVPPALDAAVMRGLSLEPGDRFATAHDMARAIEDAGPLVAASKIGEWVELIARETLGRRTSRVSHIELESYASLTPPSISETSEILQVPAVPAFRPPPQFGRQSDEISVHFDEIIAPTQLSSASPTPRASEAPARRRLALPIGIAAALVVTGVALGLVARRGAVAHADPSAGAAAIVTSSAVATEPQPTAAATAPATGVAAMPSPEVPGAEPALAASPFAAAASPARAPTDPAAAARRSQPAPQASVAKTASPTSAKPPAPNCSTPWYFDSRGVRVFKKECL